MFKIRGQKKNDIHYIGKNLILIHGRNFKENSRSDAKNVNKQISKQKLINELKHDVDDNSWIKKKASITRNI